MAYRYPKRCSISLIIRETESKSTINLTSPSISENGKCQKDWKKILARMQKKRNSSLLLGIWIGAVPMKNGAAIFLKKLKVPYDPALQLLGICPKHTKTPTQNDIGDFMVIAALLTITNHVIYLNTHQQITGYYRNL